MNSEETRILHAVVSNWVKKGPGAQGDAADQRAVIAAYDKKCKVTPIHV